MAIAVHGFNFQSSIECCKWWLYGTTDYNCRAATFISTCVEVVSICLAYAGRGLTPTVALIAVNVIGSNVVTDEQAALTTVVVGWKRRVAGSVSTAARRSNTGRTGCCSVTTLRPLCGAACRRCSAEVVTSLLRPTTLLKA